MKKHVKRLFNSKYLIILVLLIVFIFTGCSQYNNSKKIDYEILFKGFVTLDENQNPPHYSGDYAIFTSRDDWMDFCSKNLPAFSSVVTEINDRDIDFKTEYLMFMASIGPRHSYDSYFYQDPKYLLIEDGKIRIEYYNNKKDAIYVLNRSISEISLTKHASVLLFSVNIDKLPENIDNIYKKQ